MAYVPPPGGEAPITRDYLWSMLPVESAIKDGVVSGQQILDWLETSWRMRSRRTRRSDSAAGS
jgi:hypothetical protein